MIIHTWRSSLSVPTTRRRRRLYLRSRALLTARSGDDTLARGWFSVCCSRATPEVRLTKVPWCFWRCVEMRVRAHANFSSAPFVGVPVGVWRRGESRWGDRWRVIHLTRYTRFLRRFLRFRTYSLPPPRARLRDVYLR